MQLKNTESRNHQFFFHKKVEGQKELSHEYVHIPGGATVELEDEIFKAILSTKTKVSVIEERTVVLDEENIGSSIRSGKELLTMKEFYDTGRKKVVNLVQELIKSGKLLIVERPAVADMAVVDKFLNSQGIAIKDMPEDIKLSLYDKLA